MMKRSLAFRSPRVTRATKRHNLRLENLEDRHLLAGDAQLLFLGNAATPVTGADADVMQFLTDTYGVDNVTYKQTSAANNGSDLDGIDVLILSSTTGSGSIRNKFHNADVPILNWEEAVMDAGSGEFGLSSIQITKSTSMTEMTLVGNHPITSGLSGTITFVSSGETLSTSDLYSGLTAVATAANGTKSGGGGPNGIVGNPTIFIAEAGQDVDPGSGASPAAERRVMFPMTDSTFSSLTDDGLLLFKNSIDWLGDLSDAEATAPTVVNEAPTDVAALTATIRGNVTDTGGETPDVTLYYGDNDGGTNPNGWDNVVALGKQAGSFDYVVSGLADSTDYYFTSFAQNSAGSDWADSVRAFTTTALSQASVINSPATEISVRGALIGGQVSDAGGDPPLVTIYWGDNDGGVTKDNWDNAIPLGFHDAAFQWELGGLEPQTTYYFRAFAENAAGGRWANNTEAFITLSPLLEDITMFNDHRAGGRTGDNVTDYAANGTAGGPLLNFETGEQTDFTLTTSEVGVKFGLWSFWPEEGTDAYEIFNGAVDFTLGPGAEIALDPGDSYTHSFANLDLNSRYDFTGTHARGNSSYEERWTLVTLEGADSFTPAHSDGIGVYTDGLPANQVALWTGINNQSEQGFVARWSDIDPGDDGTFDIVQTRYDGAIPTSVEPSGVAGGAASFGLTATRLIKSFAGLAVLNSDPGLNEKFQAAPTTATINFSSAVDAATVAASDLTVDGVAATGVTIVDADTVAWQLPAGLGVGQHIIALADDSLLNADGGEFIGYTSPFFVVTNAGVENLAASNIAATTAVLNAEIPSTGFDDPTLRIYWGDNDGGTTPANWDNVLDLGLAGEGMHSGLIEGLDPSEQYYYRAQVTNLAGDTWANTASSFTSATPVLATVTNSPAVDVSAFTVTLGGEVISDGNDPPTITLFYGSTDGGTNAAAWENSIDVGKQTSSFATFVAGLSKETDYFYRVRATNLAGPQWATSTASFTTTGLPALTISEVAPSNTGGLLTTFRLYEEGDFGPPISPDWIEIYNPSPGPLDLVGLHLTDSRSDMTKWQFPVGSVIPANGYLVVYATNQNLLDPALDSTGRLHTNFTLTGSGEYLALTGGSGEVIFEYAPEFPNTRSGYTFGLDANGDVAFFENPTIGEANDDSSIFPGFVADTRFSLDRGFYDAAITVDITTNTPGATIVYTTDGSEPTLDNGTSVVAVDGNTSPVASVDISTTTAVRARAYLDGWVPTNADSHSYLFLQDIIEQPDQPDGFPTRWNGAPSVDYGMDPEVFDDPNYRSDLLAGLREIPTLSITSDVENLFGASGLYSNTQSTQEVPASAELILQDGSTGFQIDAGLKLQGGASRNPNRSPKHSMSLRFRDVYGEGKLNYPLFGDSPVESFDSLQLRGMYNNSWIHWAPEQRNRGTLIRDQFVRDLMVEMGNPDAQQGAYMHVYLDGLYWGVYNVHERADENHYSAYNGGDQLDALNGGRAIDGSLDSYNAMRDTVRNSGDWDAIQQVLDVDNYIDWTILQRFGSNNDLKSDGNWRAAGGGPNNEPWRFYLWDTERILEGVNEGGPGGTADPPGILSALSQLEEFRLRFADRVQMHFFNDGPLTPERAVETWDARVTELTNAIVGESARWGDYRRDVHVEGPASLFTRNDFWLPEIERLRTTYFPRRTDIVVNQYRSNGLFPSIDAPRMQIDGQFQHGGEVEATASLDFDADAGTVYYTLDGSDPRMTGGDPAGTAFTQPVTLNESTTVSARLRAADGTWSALSTANFVVVPAANVIVVSEVNYNPHDVTVAETSIIPNLSTSDFEFIEVLNTGATTVNLLDMQFADGVEFRFPDFSLASGERAVVVENLDGFRARYGESPRVIGQWNGGLANNGERIALADGVGNVFLDFEYSDSRPWATRADGFGGTLVLVDESNATAELAGKSYSWRGSVEFGGTPGSASAAPFNVVINEVLANSDDVGNGDAIELFNVGNESVDISGWYLSDSGNDPLKFEIPAGNVLAPGGFAVFDESDFNPNPSEPSPQDFALSGMSSDDVWLVIPNGDSVGSFVDDVHFGATNPGESIGRFGDHPTTPLIRSSLGCDNSQARVGPVIISEVNYNPGEPSAAAIAIYADLVEDDLEYIEIHNPTSVAINLQDWRVRGGINHSFDESTAVAPGGTLLLLSFNPNNPANSARVSAFRQHYGLAGNVALAGGYGGQLSDSGEAIRLRDANGVLSDEVVYDDRLPWAVEADGQGQALSRVLPTAWTNAESWRADTSPGEQTFLNQPGDFNGDGVINTADIDLLLFAIDSGKTVTTHDMNSDFIVNQADVTALLDLGGIQAGDVNLDGIVNALDLNRLGRNWLSSNCASWENGDFNGDGIVNAVDLNVIGSNWLAGAALQNARIPRAPLAVVVNPMAEQGPVGVELGLDKVVLVEPASVGASSDTLRAWNRTSTLHRRGAVPIPAKVVDDWFAALGDDTL